MEQNETVQDSASGMIQLQQPDIQEELIQK